MGKKAKKIEYRCLACGSTEIIREVMWDVESQDWTGVDGFDKYCDMCSSTRIEEVPVDGSEEEENQILIGLGYKKRSGKDTVADILVRDYGFVKISFAEPLKDLCSLLVQAHKIGEDRVEEVLEGWFSKNCSKEDEFRMLDKVKELFKEGITEDMFDVEDGKFRKLLQFVGTDVFRAVEDNFWVRLAFSGDIPERMVISDVRFENELDAINEMDGISVLVHRDTGLMDTHASETALDGAVWTYYIDNNGTLEELEEKVHDLIEDIEEVRDEIY